MALQVINTIMFLFLQLAYNVEARALQFQTSYTNVLLLMYLSCAITHSLNEKELQY